MKNGLVAGKARGIIQSRGLGDILISLPIARAYYERGEEIVWPIDEQFMGSVVDTVKWVKWCGMKADERGAYFVETPLSIFKYNNVDEGDALYLYHYLNSQPQMTNPELFNILKFDQYKYAVAGVPFYKKWELDRCVARNIGREAEFKNKVLKKAGVTSGDKGGGRYAIIHLEGSTFKAEVDLSWIDPAVTKVYIDGNTMSDNVFDWCSLIEGAEHVVCVDSVIANMIEGMMLKRSDNSELDKDLDLYWIRRSAWDLTPVLGLRWKVISTDLPIVEPVRVNPAAEAKILIGKIEAARRAQQQQGSMQDPAVTGAAQQSPPPGMIPLDQHPANAAWAQRRAAGITDKPKDAGNSIHSSVPFQAAGKIPKSFLDKVKPLTAEQAAMLNGGGNTRAAKNAANQRQQPAVDLSVKF